MSAVPNHSRAYRWRRFFNWFPLLRRIPARLIGLGVRPEHVRTPEARP